MHIANIYVIYFQIKGIRIIVNTLKKTLVQGGYLVCHLFGKQQKKDMTIGVNQMKNIKKDILKHSTKKFNIIGIKII